MNNAKRVEYQAMYYTLQNLYGSENVFWRFKLDNWSDWKSAAHTTPNWLEGVEYEFNATGG